MRKITLVYRRIGVTAPVLSDGLATMAPGISERTNGATKFSHLDRLGTNAQTTDAWGGVVDLRRYDAFGLPFTIANPTGSQQGFASAFGYQEDAESGLKLLGHRYYDAGTGRFITRDPIGSGTNWYAYAGNNPLKQVDPDGLKLMSVQDYDKANGTSYTDRVRTQIGNLRANGEGAAADSLEGLLAAGRIEVEDDPSKWTSTDGYGRTFQTGGHAESDGSAIVINAFTFQTRANLEITLLHEYVHWNDINHRMPPTEAHACQVAGAYAGRRRDLLKKSKDEQWRDFDSWVNNQSAYAKAMFPWDQKRVLAWLRKYFGSGAVIR